MHSPLYVLFSFLHTASKSLSSISCLILLSFRSLNLVYPRKCLTLIPFFHIKIQNRKSCVHPSLFPAHFSFLLYFKPDSLYHCLPISLSSYLPILVPNIVYAVKMYITSTSTSRGCMYDVSDIYYEIMTLTVCYIYDDVMARMLCSLCEE